MTIYPSSLNASEYQVISELPYLPNIGHSEISRIFEKINSNNHDSLALDLKFKLQEDYLFFQNPHTGENSVCVFSEKRGWCNYLVMRDSSHVWVIAQMQTLINLVVIDNVMYGCASYGYIISHEFEHLQYILQFIHDNQLDFPVKLDGIIVSQPRPFHYFYDVLLNVRLASETLWKTQKTIRYIDFQAYYYPCNSEYAVPTIQGPSSKHCYLLPCTTDCRAIFLLSERAEEMERWILQTSLYQHGRIQNRIYETDYDLVLWIGITGQKRCWISQVDGYSNIIAKLSNIYPKLLILIDGWTSTLKQNDKCLEDWQVAEDIVTTVGEMTLSSNVDFELLIDRSYTEKVAYCSAADVSITNSGFGSFIPLRVCQTPGVRHSNGFLDTFGLVNYEYSTLVTAKQVSMPVHQSIDSINYDLDWEDIYDCVVKCIRPSSKHG